MNHPEYSAKSVLELKKQIIRMDYSNDLSSSEMDEELANFHISREEDDIKQSQAKIRKIQTTDGKKSVNVKTQGEIERLNEEISTLEQELRDVASSKQEKEEKMIEILAKIKSLRVTAKLDRSLQKEIDFNVSQREKKYHLYGEDLVSSIELAYLRGLQRRCANRGTEAENKDYTAENQERYDELVRFIADSVNKQMELRAHSTRGKQYTKNTKSEALKPSNIAEISHIPVSVADVKDENLLDEKDKATLASVQFAVNTLKMRHETIEIETQLNQKPVKKLEKEAKKLKKDVENISHNLHVENVNHTLSKNVCLSLLRYSKDILSDPALLEQKMLSINQEAKNGVAQLTQIKDWNVRQIKNLCYALSIPQDMAEGDPAAVFQLIRDKIHQKGPRQLSPEELREENRLLRQKVKSLSNKAYVRNRNQTTGSK